MKASGPTGPSARGEGCYNCRFGGGDGDSNQQSGTRITCRRFPPPYVLMPRSGWCGEWKRGRPYKPPTN